MGGGNRRPAGQVGTHPSRPPETESVYPSPRRSRNRTWSQVALKSPPTITGAGPGRLPKYHRRRSASSTASAASKTGATGCAATTVTGPPGPAISVRTSPRLKPGTRSGAESGNLDHTATPCVVGAVAAASCGSRPVSPAVRSASADSGVVSTVRRRSTPPVRTARTTSCGAARPYSRFCTITRTPTPSSSSTSGAGPTIGAYCTAPTPTSAAATIPSSTDRARTAAMSATSENAQNATAKDARTGTTAISAREWCNATPAAATSAVSTATARATGRRTLNAGTCAGLPARR